jgi:hypothetical protein
MRTLAEGFAESLRLIADSFRLWWRNLLPMTTWFLAGYVGFRASINAAVWLAEHQHQSLGVGVFSAGVLIQIGATVGMIRTCASSLYRWRDAARREDEETTDPTEKGLLELLSLTMLPLVAVWSAWGFLNLQVTELNVSNLVARGTGPGTAFFALINGGWKAYLPAIVILLVLRRVIEAVDDRWPSRPTKFLQVWAEAFFLLLTVVVTPYAVSTFKNWFKERNFWYFSVDWWAGAKDWFAGIHIPIPAGLEFLWGVFWETLWPLFKLGVGEPLTWLAITTVVFGHRVLAASGVFSGTRVEKLGSHGVPAETSRFVALTNKAPNLVLGGLREKFYPTLNAFRLLVRVGPVFLGVVCLVYTLWSLGGEWTFVLFQRLIGVHGQRWGVMDAQIAGTVQDLIFEPLRIALLAAAFDQCISVGAQRRAEQAEAAQKKQAEQPAPQVQPAEV